MNNGVVVLAIVALALGSTTACATKKHVNTQVDETNSKVVSLTNSMEETKERVLRNEKRLGEVDRTAVSADSKAMAADSKATTAALKADEARTAADTAGAKADAVDRASKRLLFEVVLSEDKGNFKTGRVSLPKEVMADLDKLIEQLKADPKGAYIEIEGHTDSTGPTEFNERLGLERAEATKRYLYEQHQVPLHKMNVISYGEQKPVAPNTTRDGRAKNRRVVLRVLG